MVYRTATSIQHVKVANGMMSEYDCDLTTSYNSPKMNVV